MTSWRKSRLFKTYFLSYLMVVVVITSLLSLTLIQLIGNAVRTELAQISYNRLSYADSIITKSLLEPAEKLVHDHMLSSKLANISGAYSHYELHRYLNEQISTLPFIESLSVYYPADRLLISTNHVKYNYTDNAALEAELAAFSKKPWRGVTEPAAWKQPARKVIQYAKPSIMKDKGNDQKPLYYIFVSVYERSIQQTIASQQIGSHERIAIMNREGELVSATGAGLETESLRALPLDRDRYHIMEFGDNKDMMVAASFMSNTQWYYVLMMPLSDFLQIIYHIKDTILAVSSTILLIGLVLSLIAAVTHSIPVQRVIANMRDAFGHEGGNAHNEFKFLQDSIKKLYATMKDLRSKESAGIISNLLRGVIDAPYESAMRNWMPLERYIVLAVASSEADDADRTNDWISNLRNKVSLEDNQVFTLPYNKDIVAVIVNYSCDFEVFGRQLHEAIASLPAEQNSRIRIGIGSEEREVMNLHVSCDRALQALRYHYLLPEPQTSIVYSEIEELDNYVLRDEYDLLKQALKNNDVDSMRAAVKDIAASLMQGRYQYESVEYSIYRILPVITKKLMECDVKIQVAASFFSKATIFESFEWLEDILAESVSLHKEASSNATEMLMERVRAYIDEHYTQELSLELLSQKTFISASYISSLFKKTFHVGVSEYISSLRLEKASELLVNGQDKVEEVAVKVGMPNIPYFITKFKKKYGQTPNQYRRERAVLELESSLGK